VIAESKDRWGWWEGNIHIAVCLDGGHDECKKFVGLWCLPH